MKDNSTANTNPFKRGDIVRNSVNSVNSWIPLVGLEPVVQSETPRVDEALANAGTVIVDLAKELEREVVRLTHVAETQRTELDAKAGIVEALENDLARAEHSRKINSDLHDRAIRERDEWMKIADERQFRINRLEGEVKNWQETAAKFLGDMRHYHDLLVQCGQAIGKEAYTCDDGTVQQDVLVAKVPELVKDVLKWNAELIDKVNRMPAPSVANEPDLGQWLGEHAVQALETAEPTDHTEGGKYRMLEDIDPPDYAAEAKDILQEKFGLNTPMFRDTSLDAFVDLIIKAAKQP